MEEELDADTPPPPGMGSGPADVPETPGQQPYYEEAENLDPDPALADPAAQGAGQ